MPQLPPLTISVLDAAIVVKTSALGRFGREGGLSALGESSGRGTRTFFRRDDDGRDDCSVFPGDGKFRKEPERQSEGSGEGLRLTFVLPTYRTSHRDVGADK